MHSTDTNPSIMEIKKFVLDTLYLNWPLTTMVKTLDFRIKRLKTAMVWLENQLDRKSKNGIAENIIGYLINLPSEF